MNNFTQYVNPYLGKMLEKVKMDKNFVKGAGCYLYDDYGNEYLDFIAAYGALPFGYNPQEIWNVILDIYESKEPSFIQPSVMEAASQLAKKLIEITPDNLKYVTFTNSGAETVEVAMKLCRSATNRVGILSTYNSFHGKTLGALSATGKNYYQKGFGAPVEGFNYIKFGDISKLESELNNKPEYYAAFILEPIQGEGGIITAPDGYLKDVKEICSRFGVKVIFDEIQTGLGRTGSLFAFEREGVTPDVLLLAKALGGGIVPIGACISSEEVYNEEFGNKHSSTFAGNTLGCRIGLRVLDILDNEFIDNINVIGNFLKENLQKLKIKYPHIIRSIRGRGLMLGIELGIEKDTFPGSLIGMMAQQEVLTPIITSYLLNIEKLRVAPTLNGTNVIRIEPPLIVTEAECRRAILSLEGALKTLEKGNTAKLLAFLTNANTKRKYKECKHDNIEKVEPPKDEEGRFAFLIHPISIENYTDFDNSLCSFTKEEIKKIASRWNDMIDPCVVSQTRIISKTGKTAFGEFILVPRTAEELLNLSKEEALAQLKKALDIAKKRGARIVGLGAYTSVISGGGLLLIDEEIPLTTGNSYTVVAAVDAVSNALIKVGGEPEKSSVAIVGATGSIGRGVAMLVAESFAKIILIGNPNNKESSIKRLNKISGKIFRYISYLINQNYKFKEGSLGYRLISTVELPQWNDKDDAFYDFACKASIGKELIKVTTDINEQLTKADVVISATSNVGKLITSGNLKTGSIVCDMSRPRNVCKDVVRERPDVLVIDGGLIEVPSHPNLGLKLGFGNGLAYACMSETMMLALEGHYVNTSIGSSGISLENILLTRELAQKHGFKLAEFRSFDKSISNTRWQNVINARKEISCNIRTTEQVAPSLSD